MQSMSAFFDIRNIAKLPQIALRYHWFVELEPEHNVLYLYFKICFSVSFRNDSIW